MAEDFNRRTSDPQLVLLDAMRQWIAEPMEKRMEALEQQQRDQAGQLRDAIGAMRHDFRDAMATMSNPDTGYVPRSEINLLFGQVNAKITDFIEGSAKRERERAVNTRWLVGTVIGVTTLLATIVSVFISLFHGHLTQ